MNAIKIGTALLLVIMMSAAATAKIELDVEPEEHYNIGDSLELSYIISSEKRFEGLLRLTLLCRDYTLEYYTLPIIIDGKEKNISSAPLVLSPHSLGECSVKAALHANDNSIKESAESDEFFVTASFPVIINANVSLIKPGEDILVNFSFGDHKPKSADANMWFAGQSWKKGIKGNYVLRTEHEIKPGHFSLAVRVNDSFGNLGENYTLIEVLSVPSRLGLQLDKSIVRPYETISFFALLLDQANNSINEAVIFRISSESDEKLFEKIAETGEIAKFSPDSSTPPGEYNLTAISLEFSKTKTITVLSLKQVSVDLDNRTSKFTNTGNVDYDDTVLINATKYGKTFLIKKSAKLKPGEVYYVDLFKELPEGSYDIQFSDANKSYSSVEIEDERSAAKKVSQGISSITGAVIGTASSASSKLLFVFISIFAVVQLRKKK